MVADTILKSLSYLQVIGPAKFYTLIARVNLQKLIYISRHADHSEIIAILSGSDLDKNIDLLNETDGPTVVHFIRNLKSPFMLYLLRHLSAGELSWFSQRLPPELLCDLLLANGPENTVRYIHTIPREKMLDLVRSVDPSRLNALTRHAGPEDVELFLNRFEVPFLSKWIEQTDPADLDILLPYVGSVNLVGLADLLGESRVLELLRTMPAPEIALVLRYAKGIRLPSRTAREWQLVEMAYAGLKEKKKAVKPARTTQKTGKPKSSSVKKPAARKKTRKN